MHSLELFPSMKTRALTIMATRREDQDLVDEIALRFPVRVKNDCDEILSKLVIPAFGWHPWFSHQILDDRSSNGDPDASTHYQSVLTPIVEDESFLRSLPQPKPLTQFLAETEHRLSRHPFALMGEVGLDRSFRLPKEPGPPDAFSRDSSLTPGSREGRRLSPYKVRLDHQKVVLEAQLRLAAKMQRAVSIHSVQAHGSVHEVLKKLWSGHEKMSGRQRKRRLSADDTHFADVEDPTETVLSGPLPFPPRICMHSYSGPADFLSEFLHRTVPIDVYFSFSDVIRAVPDSQILLESDLHCAGEEMDHRLGRVFLKICSAKEWSPNQAVEILGQNWRRFVFGA
jgi:Tat protein secretion system quality control protein TatD with DNase activity